VKKEGGKEGRGRKGLQDPSATKKGNTTTSLLVAKTWGSLDKGVLNLGKYPSPCSPLGDNHKNESRAHFREFDESCGFL